jgi:hypothetical protein
MAISRFLAPMMVLTLAGCAALESEAPPIQPVGETVARASEQGGRFIALLGPRRQHAAPFLGVPGTNFYALRSWLDTKSGERLTQLYVEDSYSGSERSYGAARTGAGEALKFVPISRNEIGCEKGCSYAEEFAAKLPEPLLRAQPQGLTVIFSAKSGPDLTVAVPGGLIDKQLAAIDAARATLPAAAVTPSPAAQP